MKRVWTIVLVLAGSAVADPLPPQARVFAERLENRGREEDYLAFETWVFEAEGGRDERIEAASQVLRGGNSERWADRFIERLLVEEGRSPAAWLAAGALLERLESLGEMRGGGFVRGTRGGWNCHARDRARARRCYLEAIAAARSDEDQAAARIALADTFRFRTAEDLRTLTDLDDLPEPSPGSPPWRWGPRLIDGRSIWVNADGVFQPPGPPQNFENAATDLERVHRLLLGAAESARHGARARLELALLWRDLLDVGFVAEAGYFYIEGTESATDPDAPGEFELHTLKDDETFVVGPDGPQRVKLPEDYRFLPELKRLATDADVPPEIAEQALDEVLACLADRWQYDAAATLAREALERDPADRSVAYFLSEIGPALEFRGTRRFAEGRPVEVEVLSRELDSRTFDLWKLNVDAFDTGGEALPYLPDRPWSASTADFENLRAFFEPVASWKLALDRRPNHMPSVTSVTLPVPGVGHYLLTAGVGGGWEVFPFQVSRTLAIAAPLHRVGDPISDEGWRDTPSVFLIDAISGEPVEGAEVVALDSGEQVVSDSLGFLLGLACDRGVRVRRPGLPDEILWCESESPDALDPERVEAFFVANQPVYRPGQRVDYAGWLKRPQDRRLHPAGIEEWAEVRVRITDPVGQVIEEKEVPLDEFDGFSGGFELSEHIVLGDCKVELWLHEPSDNQDPFADRPGPRKEWKWRQLGSHSWGGSRWQIEVAEFRKPDFDVVVEASSGGRDATAVVTARYHSGEPVKGAGVRAQLTAWPGWSAVFPERRWEGLYGAGYDWPLPAPVGFADWMTWGVISEEEQWRSEFYADDAEIEIEAEGVTDADGRAILRFPIKLPRLGECSYDCDIRAVVREFTGRTVEARDSLVVTGHEYEVLARPGKGFHRVGEPVEVEIHTLNVRREGVPGQGVFTVESVAPGGGGEIMRRGFSTDRDGRTTLAFTPPGAGRFRCLAEAGGGKRGFVLEVIGEGDGAGDYGGVALIPERSLARPGDTVEVLVRTDAAEACVWWFEQHPDGRRRTPRLVRTRNHSATVRVPLARMSIPASYYQAATVCQGRLKTATCRIAVPPEDTRLDVRLTPETSDPRPGDSQAVDIAVTDPTGAPAAASLAVTVFDRALEDLAGKLGRVGDAMSVEFDDVASIRSSQEEDPETPHAFAQLWQPGCFMEARADLIGEVPEEPAGRFARIGELLAVVYEPPELPNSVGGGAAFPVTPATPSAGGFARAAATSLEPADEQALAGVGVRRRLADRAYWGAMLRTGADGRARVSFDLPDNLTEWRVQSWAVGKGNRFGDAWIGITTSKPLQVRPLLPRAAVVGDRLEVGAMIQNLSDEPATFQVMMEAGGRSQPTKTLQLDAGGEGLAGWTLVPAEAGTLPIVFRARSSDGVLTDAVEERLSVASPRVPVRVATSAELGDGTTSMRLDFGEQVAGAPVTVALEASPAVAALAVLPDLVAHPYGCTEQTLNRFLPLLVAWRSTEGLGIAWEDVRRVVAEQPTSLAWLRGRARPAFETTDLTQEKVRDMIYLGLHRLRELQGSSGSWGWFGAEDDRHAAYLTALALRGFQRAEESMFLLEPDPAQEAVEWLEQWAGGRAKAVAAGEVGALDAWVAHVLCESGSEKGSELAKALWPSRDSLPAVSLIHLALTFDPQDRSRLEPLLDEVRDRFDAEQDLSEGTEWWRNRTETRAWMLKLLARVDAPPNELERGIAALLAERADGVHWRSTRESALCLEAILEASSRLGADLKGRSVELTVEVDGSTREARLDADNLWTTRLVFDAPAGPRNGVSIRLRRGAGPLVRATASAAFDSDRPAAREAEDQGIRVERRYLRVGTDGTRTDLGDRPRLEVGDLVEVVLRLGANRELPFVHLVDPLPAGLEPVTQLSGHEWGAYRESRSGETGFFLSELSRWNAEQRYLVRAVTRGRSQALPARADCMYSPAIGGRSRMVEIEVE